MRQCLTLISLLALFASKISCAQIVPPTPVKPADPQSLTELDIDLRDALKTTIVTQSAYNKLLYQQQVKLSGMAVQQGKTLGLNVTADDKGGTLNAGLIGIGEHKRVVVQGTVKYLAEQGFVKLFTDEKYQKTLNLGLTTLLFNNGGRSFEDQTRKALHHKFRRMRRREINYWSSDEYDTAWNNAYLDYWRKLLAFRAARKSFEVWLLQGLSPSQISDYLSDKKYPRGVNGDRLKWYDRTGKKLGQTTVDNATYNDMYRDYVDAEQDVYPLLEEDNWAELSYREERPVLRDVLDETSATNAPLNRWLTSRLIAVWTESNERKLEQQATAYDSLQQKADWVKVTRSWLSISAFYNTVKQPIFSLANKPQTYAGEKVDEYFQGQVAYNFLREGKRANLYFSLGAGVNNMLVFAKKDLLTYQTSSWQKSGIDSALVVTQKQLYANVPPRVWYINPHPQLAITFPQAQNVGISLNADLLVAINESTAQNKYSYAAGIFLPVQAEKTTLLLMPQVRWNSTDKPNPWTIGFSLTASVPGFISTR